MISSELEPLKEENALLRKKRGLACGCNGDCIAHTEGDCSLSRLKPHQLHILGARPRPKPVRSKRKQFDQLSVYGRRRGLRDLRGLFKIKEIQYNAPVSRLAGYIIQQVSIHTLAFMLL